MPPAVATPADQCRPEEQTFLTIPEWFLVFSPKEYAEDVQRRPPSSFPFFDHIVQFWRGYRAVVRATENYPVNWGYHLMVVVIGVSTTVEYGMKGVYESTLGRLTEATCPHGADARRPASGFRRARIRRLSRRARVVRFQLSPRAAPRLDGNRVVGSASDPQMGTEIRNDDRVRHQGRLRMAVAARLGSDLRRRRVGDDVRTRSRAGHRRQRARQD